LTPTACDHIDTAAGDAFFLLTLIGPKLWSRRWCPTKVGMMNISNHASGVCTPSRRWTCWPLSLTCS
jgi:hypothetical protein